jgi:hypothetical protein
MMLCAAFFLAALLLSPFATADDEIEVHNGAPVPGTPTDAYWFVNGDKIGYSAVST